MSGWCRSTAAGRLLGWGIWPFGASRRSATAEMEAARERGRTRVPIRCGAQVSTVLLVNASWSPGQTAACVLGVSAVSVRSFSFHPLLRHRTYTEHVGRGATSPSVQWRWPVYPLHKSQPCQGPSIYVHAEFRVMATIGTHTRKCQISSFVVCVCFSEGPKLATRGGEWEPIKISPEI